MIVKQFNPKLVAEENLLPDWLMEKLKSLAEQAPFGDGRVQLAFAFDGLFLPKEIVQNLFKSVREIGIRNITLHYVPGPLMGRLAPLRFLVSAGDSADELQQVVLPLLICSNRMTSSDRTSS